MTNNLSNKVSKGVVWLSAINVSIKLANLLSAIVLTRLLEPKDFGLMAITMAIIFFSMGVTQTGFNSALIQKQDNQDKQDKVKNYFNTAWTFDLLRHLLLAIIIYFSAPILSTFFHEPDLQNILRVLLLIFIFQGFRNIGVLYFRKELAFKKQFFYQIIPEILYLMAVIPLAFVLRNVWSLVLAKLISEISSCLLSYYVHAFRPKLEFNKEKLKSLFQFGKWIFLESVIKMIREQGIEMIIEKALGTKFLGYYNRSTVFSQKLFRQLTMLVWGVGYPLYSILSNDKEKLKNIYLKTLKLLTFLGMPLAGGLLVLSTEFVQIVLTSKWLSIVPLIQLFCIHGLTVFINTPAQIVFQALGKPAIGAKISTFGIALLILTIYPCLTIWGLSGVVFSLLISSIFTIPLIITKVSQELHCSMFDILKIIFLPLINTTLMSFAIINSKNFIFKEITFTSFILLILIGVILYLLVALIFDKILNYGVYNLIRGRIDALLSKEK